ncbi:hypothetical protein D9M71_814250 [compost metagenome]
MTRPSTLQVRLYFSELVGNSGRAPTRIFTSRTLSKRAASEWAAMPMKPGARPHCGMNAVLASLASSMMVLVACTSSVRSK